MTALVTGSSGHLGEALVRTLRERGAPVVGLDVVPSPFTDRIGSIDDEAVVRDAVRGVDVVYHTATLHKPHVATHGEQSFVATNVTGTLNLLQAAVAARVRAFVFTSTTSTFGAAMNPAPGEPAVWVTEALAPVPKNIYGVTKVAAESLCELFHRRDGLACLVLKTSRFFPEPDDDPAVRARFPAANAQANEFLNRRVEIEDLVAAHLLAAGRAPDLGFGRYIVSATSPFEPADAAQLNRDAGAVIDRRVPEARDLYATLGWSLPDRLDRVYDNAAARRDLGWSPRWDFAAVVRDVAAGGRGRSALVDAIGIKGYHGDRYADGIYPV